MRKYFNLFIVSIFLLVTSCGLFAPVAETIIVPTIFGDNMVLQQNIDIPVWGKATPGGKVAVTLNNQKKTAVAKADSSWMIKFSPISAGGLLEMQIMAKDTVTYKNVMIGEVWVCSGQSNMEMPIAGWGKVNNYMQELAEANYPNIRLFQVENATAMNPRWDVKTTGWAECDSASVSNFSSVGYFFGRKLLKTLDVPIGLIDATWGGTIVEAWTSGQTLKEHPDFTQAIAEMDSAGKNEAERLARYQQKLAEWNKAVNKEVIKQSNGEDYSQLDVKDAGWPTMQVPCLWEDEYLPNFNGMVWFRKSFSLTASEAKKEWTLSLGPIDDIDLTWVNGKQVGNTGVYNAPRVYKVPAEYLKAGKNVIAVRVLDTGGGGGIWGSPNQVKISDGNKTIPLAGAWKYKKSIMLTGLPQQPQAATGPNRPTVLHNAMIHPLIPYAIKGAIWYQGEANTGRAYQYREIFPLLIQDWRTKWDQGAFGFYFVQLANFMARADQPTESEWAELREAQLMTLSLPKTGMAVTIDIGDAYDIHPKNKQDVGLRLAANALRISYKKKDVVPCGPIYKEMVVEGDAVRLSFDWADGGLVAKDDKVEGFSICGADSQFVWANAKIDGETVIVSNPDVKAPIAVRYGWADNPAVNVYNKAGYPATPFRTDDFPGITKGAK